MQKKKKKSARLKQWVLKQHIVIQKSYHWEVSQLDKIIWLIIYC